MKIFFIFFFIFLSVKTIGFSQQTYDDSFMKTFSLQKRNLNRLKLSVLRRLFRLIHINENKSDTLYHFYKKHPISHFEQLQKIGFNSSEIELLKKYLILTTRLSDEQKSRLNDFLDEENEETIAYYKDLLLRPVELNNAGKEELLSLPHFDPSKVQKILRYRRIHEITTLSELTNLGWEPEELGWLRPFVSLRASTQTNFTTQISILSRQTLSETTKQFVSQNTNKSTYSTRFSLDNNLFRFYAGVRDSIFPLFSPWNQTLANGTANLLIHYKNADFLIGDFDLRCGQGLLFGSAMSTPIGSLTAPPFYRKDRGLKATTSLSPDINQDHISDHFRGLAVSWNSQDLILFSFRPKIRSTVFYSLRTNAQSFQQIGMSLSSLIPLFDTSRIGFNILSDFQSQKFSFYYDTRFRNPLHIYGEFAFFQNLAFFQGIAFQTKALKFSTVAYLSCSNFQAPYGSPFPHSRRNTFGILTGFSIRHWSGKYHIIADIYSIPFEFPMKQKYEFQYQKSFHFRSFLKQTKFLLKTKYSNPFENPNIRNTLYFRFFFKAPWNLTLKYQNLILIQTNLVGHSIGARAEWQFSNLSFSAGTSFYCSKTSATTLYGVEPQITLGETGIKSYNGTGSETFARIKWKITQNVQLNGKYLFEFNQKDEITLRQHLFAVYFESRLI